MELPLRVARVDELPPGKGKRVEIGGREVLVYNLEGRLQASASGAIRLSPAEPPCSARGFAFDVAVEDSPARLENHDRRYAVGIEGEFIVLHLEDAAAT